MPPAPRRKGRPRSPIRTGELDRSFWRAIAAFRIVALGYAAALIIRDHEEYVHPAGGWVVLGVMAAWTAGSIFAYRRPTVVVVGADLLITLTCLLTSAFVQPVKDLEAGGMPLTGIWVAAPAFAWGVYGGRRAGATAGVVLALGDLWLGGLDGDVAHGGKVILVVGGWVAGHVTRLARDAEERMERAVEMEAATRERERMARDIHDSVLQVLALVQRRGAEIGDEAAELGRLAGEQEAALRNLIRSRDAEGNGLADLGSMLRPFVSESVEISAPATPIEVPAKAAREVTAAVAAALDNVRAHGGDGARAWILAEEMDGVVMVTVRDDGLGMNGNRLAEAEAEGRLGVAGSIRGRIRDLGGTVTITSAPGEGTEVEMTVPHSPRDR